MFRPSNIPKSKTKSIFLKKKSSMCSTERKGCKPLGGDSARFLTIVLPPFDEQEDISMSAGLTLKATLTIKT